jgi:hypothetical protein
MGTGHKYEENSVLCKSTSFLPFTRKERGANGKKKENRTLGNLFFFLLLMFASLLSPNRRGLKTVLFSGVR